MLRPSKRPRLSTRTFTSKAWSVSPKVHAYRFVVTPDEAITRFDAVANQWRPAAGLDWKSSRFGLVYFPIWYTGAELRCNLDIESEDTTQRADLSLLGGMPGHYDQFLSTLNYQSYLPAVGKLKVPPSRRFTEPILRQHDHPIFPLPFNISPFIFDILDFESTGVQLTEGISISQNPKILFNAAFPVLVPLYVANYEAKSTSSKETYVQYHCIEAFSKDLSSHFSTTFIQSSPEESREHHTHPHSQLPNQPPLLPPGLQMNFLLHREEEEYVEVRDSFMSLLLEARETPDILRGLHKKLPFTMDDIRVRPLKELELEKMHKFIAALRPLNEFEVSLLNSLLILLQI
ncbi:hypothetical protein DL96DRAFT_1779377 [Flagelloscypha sp. PMI_526]|nr:hypothetical protein DL96DRAFT_1779377 [Flagelloscypha sp. PMI_526]